VLIFKFWAVGSDSVPVIGRQTGRRRPSIGIALSSSSNAISLLKVLSSYRLCVTICRTFLSMVGASLVAAREWSSSRTTNLFWLNLHSTNR